MFPTMFPMCFQHVPKDVLCNSHHIPQDVSICSQCYSQHVPQVPKVLPIAQHFIQYLFGQSRTCITYKGGLQRTTPILPLWGSTQSFPKKHCVGPIKVAPCTHIHIFLYKKDIDMMIGLLLCLCSPRLPFLSFGIRSQPPGSPQKITIIIQREFNRLFFGGNFVTR